MDYCSRKLDSVLAATTTTRAKATSASLLSPPTAKRRSGCCCCCCCFNQSDPNNHNNNNGDELRRIRPHLCGGSARSRIEYTNAKFDLAHGRDSFNRAVSFGGSNDAAQLVTNPLQTGTFGSSYPPPPTLVASPAPLSLKPPTRLKRRGRLAGELVPLSATIRLCFSVGALLLILSCNLIELTRAKSIESSDTSSLGDKVPKSSSSDPQEQLLSSIDIPIKSSDQIVKSNSLEPPPQSATTTTTTSSEEAPVGEEEDDASTGGSDCDASDCSDLLDGERTEAQNYTDNDRLVKLQTELKRKMKNAIKDASRHGMDVFSKLSLSGGCMNSLWGLSGGLADLKSYAVKFVDASAKIPSGVMYGLLSDFGDFDECLSIRSNPLVAPEDEESEGAFSGKYCLLSIRFNLHIELENNTTVPKGIDEDGLIWDDLLRQYWTTNSSKGFQVGVCLPSRCKNDDIDQLYRYVAESYNTVGELMSCQDRNDLNRQTTPDLLQRIILVFGALLVCLSIVGTLLDRYTPLAREPIMEECTSTHQNYCLMFTLKFITSFSVITNWKLFMSSHKTFDLSTSINRASTICRRNSAESNTIVQQVHSFITQTSPSSSRSTSGMSSVNELDGIANRDSAKLAEKTEAIDGSTSQRIAQQLSVQVQPIELMQRRRPAHQSTSSLQFLSGLRLFVIVWITIGHSFLYPSAHNYQYYRSIINMSVTRNSVWFATTNFTLGIDMILYMTGLVLVYKLARSNRSSLQRSSGFKSLQQTGTRGIRLNLSLAKLIRMIARKVLRFWPTYLTVIALAIVIPLFSDGPMWPEMVSNRIGSTCRRNWWTNLLMINNFYSESELCLPSSWFISVLMQLFLIGAIVIAIIGKLTHRIAVATLTLLTVGTSALLFRLASTTQVRAPVIKMDETFVLEMDEKVFRLYTSVFSNIGPFLVGMIGGLILIDAEDKKHAREQRKLASWIDVDLPPKSTVKEAASRSDVHPTAEGENRSTSSHSCCRSKSLQKTICKILINLAIATIVVAIATAVLSSTFFDNYTNFWSATYWSLHRIGWAIFTGYIVHNCALERWRLLRDFLSLSTFEPVSKLMFVAYLIYPLLIHVHSGLVRDGLHVSIYNMMNIYITRLVMTFTIALVVHLLVELPASSIEEKCHKLWLQRKAAQLSAAADSKSNQANDICLEDKSNPLISIAPKQCES